MYQELSKEIKDALESYQSWWQDLFSQETVYGFCLYSTSLVEYLGVTVFTEEGLASAAQKYKSYEFYEKRTIDDLKQELRWSACDSPHHFENEDIFENVNNKLQKISEETYDLDPDCEEFKQHNSAMYGALVDAINDFRVNSTLNTESVLFTVWFGDQSEEEVRFFVRGCNEPGKAEMFFREWS